jgi:hypothetical protein
MINADPSAYSPREDEEQAKHTQHRINTDRTGQQVVHVHQYPKPCCDTRQYAYSNGNFSPGHQEGEKSYIGKNNML